MLFSKRKEISHCHFCND